MSKTVVVSGATGYLAGWVVRGALERGYTVRASARDPDNASKVGHLLELEASLDGKLELFKADLLDEGAFDEACVGADAIIHTASPFVLKSKDPQRDLVDPALKGTTNVLASVNKAESVKRVVLTSSVVSIYGDASDIDPPGRSLTEDDWNTSSSLTHQPYPYSKTLAEKAAWSAHDAQERWSMATINPGFIFGPSLSDRVDGESADFMLNLLRGKLATGAPSLMFGLVDVRDVALAHLNAVDRDDAEGRHILCAGSMWVLDMAKALREEFGATYKLPKSTAPNPLLYMVGPFMGFSWKFLSRNLGLEVRFDNQKSRDRLGIDYREVKDTLVDHAKQLIERDLV